MEFKTEKMLILASLMWQTVHRYIDCLLRVNLKSLFFSSLASSPEENASRKRRLDEDDDASQIELHQKKSKIEEPEKSLQPSTSSFTSSTTSSFLQQNSASDPLPRPPTSPQPNTVSEKISQKCALNLNILELSDIYLVNVLFYTSIFLF